MEPKVNIFLSGKTIKRVSIDGSRYTYGGILKHFCKPEKLNENGNHWLAWQTEIVRRCNCVLIHHLISGEFVVVEK